VRRGVVFLVHGVPTGDLDAALSTI
jgi:hypothetical protein